MPVESSRPPAPEFALASEEESLKYAEFSFGSASEPELCELELVVPPVLPALEEFELADELAFEAELEPD